MPLHSHKIRQGISLLLGLGWIIGTKAQSVDSSMDWTIRVVKFYRPPLQLGERIPTPLPPDPPLNIQLDPTLEKAMPTRPPARVGDSLPRISLPRLARERLQPLPRFYAKAMIGNYAHFRIDFLTNSTYYPDKVYSIALRHQSGHYKLPHSSFSNQELVGNDERFLRNKKWLWYNQLRASRASDGLYWEDSTAVDRTADSFPTYRQWRIRWQSKLTKVRYRMLPFSLMPAFQVITRGRLREWSAQFEGMVYDTFAERHQVSIRTETEVYWIVGDSSAFQRMRYQITPAYAINYLGGRLHVGFSAASTHEKVFYFFPDIMVEYPIQPGILTLRGGLDGSIQRFDYWHAFKENPYLTEYPLLYFPVRTFHLYGQARWLPLPRLYGTLRVASEHVRNTPFYYADSTSAPAMNIQYRTFRFFRVSADLVVVHPLHWDLNGGWRFDYTRASIENDTVRAWHLPTFRMEAWARLSPHRKVVISPSAEWVGQRPVLTLEGKESSLPAYFLLHLTIQYRHSEMVAAHLRFDNLTNQLYHRWYGYPGTGFRIEGGLSIRF